MKKFHHYVFCAALVLFAATAWYSVGYYHADEHYQIIEFARIKQGLNQPADMAWEYEAQIRSTIQPVIAYLIFSALKIVHVTDPYVLAFILRLLSAAFILYAIRLWVNQHQDKFTPFARVFFILMSYGLFLVPMVSVRFSSETWSAGCILMALSCLSQEKIDTKRSAWWLGVWLGLAFLFRFQTMFLSAGLLGWLWWQKKASWSTLVSILSVVVAGALLDSWYYGQWVFTFWKYFESNLLEGVAATFGVSPWYEYFVYILKSFTLLLGVVVLLAIVYFVCSRYRNVITWMIIPFMLVNCLIAHKEERFLFPVLYLLPFILSVTINDIQKRIEDVVVLRYAFQLCISALVLFNMLALFIISFTPVHRLQVISQYIYYHYPDQPVVLLNTTGDSPYYIGSGLYARHYVQNSVVEFKVNALCKFTSFDYPKTVKVLLLTSTHSYEHTHCKEELAQHSEEWKLVATSVEPPVQWLREYFGFIRHKNNILLYERK